MGLFSQNENNEKATKFVNAVSGILQAGIFVSAVTGFLGFTPLAIGFAIFTGIANLGNVVDAIEGISHGVSELIFGSSDTSSAENETSDSVHEIGEIDEVGA